MTGRKATAQPPLPPVTLQCLLCRGSEAWDQASFSANQATILGMFQTRHRHTLLLLWRRMTTSARQTTP